MESTMSTTYHGLSSNIGPDGAALRAQDPVKVPAAKGTDPTRLIDKLGEGAVASFVAAGAVLFASLVIGSSGSLLLFESGMMRSAIEDAFVSIGLRAIGATLILGVVAFTIVAALRMLRR
jgi:hypothetical protein